MIAALNPKLWNILTSLIGQTGICPMIPNISLLRIGA